MKRFVLANKRGKQERERERERGGWGTHMAEYHPPYTGGVATLPLPSQSVSDRKVGHKTLHGIYLC